jgi:hypothetical protein
MNSIKYLTCIAASLCFSSSIALAQARTIETLPPVKQTPDLIAMNACGNLLAHFTAPEWDGKKKYSEHEVSQMIGLCNQPVARTICKETLKVFDGYGHKPPATLTCRD